MRLHNNSHTTIDIFINKFKNGNYSVYPLINGLSHHDALVLGLSNIVLPDHRNEFYFYRRISKHSIHEFQTSLSYEEWENLVSNNDNDTNTSFNNFLNTFLRKCCASFPKKRTISIQNSKAWLTTGIKTSCSNKRK